MLSRLLISLYDRIDAALAKHGTFEYTQKFRMSVAKYYVKHDDKIADAKQVEDLLINIFLGDHFLRLLAQAEERVLEKYARLRDATADEEDPETMFISDMLEHISTTYARSNRGLLRYKSQLPDGPIKKAFDMSRANPKWYLHPELVKDCVERGGCCGRSCRCCEKRPRKPGRKWGAGHCTIECDCCSHARGLESISIDEKVEVFRGVWRALIDPSNKAYSRRIMRAFVVGTESDAGAEQKERKGKRANC